MGISFRVCVEGRGPRCDPIAASLVASGRVYASRSVVLGRAHVVPPPVASQMAARGGPFAAVQETASAQARESVGLGPLRGRQGLTLVLPRLGRPCRGLV